MPIVQILFMIEDYYYRFRRLYPAGKVVIPPPRVSLGNTLFSELLVLYATPVEYI